MRLVLWTLMCVCLWAPLEAWAQPLPASEETLTAEELREIEEMFAEETTPPPTAPVSGGGMGLDLAIILDVALAWFSEDPHQTGGHDPTQTGFNFQQLELSVSASVDPYFRFDANIVFGLFGVEVEEAYATTLALPWGLQARAGQFLTTFGRINTQHPHSWHFVDQPLANGKFFGGEGSRGLGVEASWLLPTPWFVELVGSATGAAGASTARSFYGAEDLGVEDPSDLLYTTAIKQFFPFNDDWSLLWGMSGQFGPNPTGLNNRTDIYGVDLYLRYRPVESTTRAALSLTVEAMLRRRQVPGDVLQDAGGYASCVWSISPRWEVGARYEYVSGEVDDELDPDWESGRHRYTTQVSFYPSHFSRLRLQGAYDDLGWGEGVWAGMLALEILTGAHGAHDF